MFQCISLSLFKQLGICVNRGHASNEAIRTTREFSVNIPSVDMVAETDYCGIVSGSKVDKSKLFEVFYGELKAAPLITKCSLNIECRLVQHSTWTCPRTRSSSGRS